MAYIVKIERASGPVLKVRFRDPITSAWRQVSGGASMADAERIRLRLEAKYEPDAKSVYRDPPETMLGRWFTSLRAGGATDRTIDSYDGKVGRLVRAWKSKPWRSWSAVAVAKWVEDLAVAPVTKRAYLATTTAFLSWALDQGAPIQPALPEQVRRIKRPKVRAKNLPVLSPDQVRSILRACEGTDLYVPVCLAAYGGLGLSDVMTLTWAEVDLERGTLSRVLGRKKTGERLDVVLPAALVEILKANPRTGRLVCAQRVDRWFTDGLAAAFEAAAVPRSANDTWRVLRRSFGSLLASEGVPPPVIGAMMGHAPGSPVTYRYLKAYRPDMEAAAGKIGARLSTPEKQAERLPDAAKRAD